jgi:hypothetical protein
MAVVTLVCVVCGIGVNFPRLFFVVLWFLPTMVVFSLLARKSKERFDLGCLVAMGAWAGTIFTLFIAAATASYAPNGPFAGWILFIALVWAPQAIGAWAFPGPVVRGAMRLYRIDDVDPDNPS